MTGAAVARADPEHSAAILVQRHDIAVAQALRVVGIVPVAHEGSRTAVEQIQSVGRRDPQPLRVVFQTAQTWS